MQVSVIICTCNRAAHLRQTLESLAGVCVPVDLPTEVLVVDNASTDGTAALVQGFHLPNMPVRYSFEPKQGQSYARNNGLAASGGEIIVFTDDDLRFPVHWLENLCRPIERGAADAVQGGIVLAPHLMRPWMTTDHKAKMASTEHFDPQNEFWLVGANMAFSRAVLSQVPQFDVELGPGALGFMDDSLFSRQLRAAGCKLVLVPDAAVVHHFDPSRLTRASFLSRAAKEGQSQAYVAHHWEHRPPSPVLSHLKHQWVRLLYWRLRRAVQPAELEGMPQWEINILQSIGFNRQMLIERRKPRNYEKQGLIKLSDTSG